MFEFFEIFEFFKFFLDFFGFLGFLSKFLMLLLKVTKVTTGHQKLLKIGQNSIITSVFARVSSVILVIIFKSYMFIIVHRCVYTQKNT